MVKETCQVVTCANEKNGDISLHTVPKEPLSAQRWNYFLEIANVKFPLWKPLKRMNICSVHFRKEDVYYGVSGKRMIKQGSFPCILEGVDISTQVNDKLREGNLEGEVQEMEIAIVPSDVQELLTTNKLQEETLDANAQKILQLESALLKAKYDLEQTRHSNKMLTQRCRRQEDYITSRDKKMLSLNEEVRKRKSQCLLPEPETVADDLLTEIIQRRNVPKSHPYSSKMKEFAFNAHYKSPGCYEYMRDRFGKFLPDPSNCTRWTRHVDVKPGILQVSMEDVMEKCRNDKVYYALAFDEMAIRQQVEYDGVKMVGQADYGGLTDKKPTGRAKSALFCLATEINGHKSFPVGYILTDGLKAKVMADFVTACITAVKDHGGNVLSIACDGLGANFSALASLGANFDLESPHFLPSICITDKHELQEDSPTGLPTINSTTHYVMPDVSHMMKLTRNTLDKFKVFYDLNDQEIRWDYIVRLQLIQDKEQLRAANNLTSRHITSNRRK